LDATVSVFFPASDGRAVAASIVARRPEALHLLVPPAAVSGDVVVSASDGKIGAFSFTVTSPADDAAHSSAASARTPATSVPQSITRTYEYQSGPNGATFLQAVSANGLRIESPVHHRGNLEPVANNDEVALARKFDKRGRLIEVRSTGGTDANARTGVATKYEYYSDDDPALHRRGEVKRITEGTLVTTFEYPTAERVIEKDPRGVVTTTDFDAWDLPIHIQVVGPDLKREEKFGYDVSGRLAYHSERKADREILTTYTRDPLGRLTSVTRNGAAVPGGSVTTRIAYDLGNRRVITTHPGGAVTTTELDGLGRVARVHVETGPGSSDIEQHFGYDLAGNLVYQSDGFTATTAAFDVFGRQVGIRHADGTATAIGHDAWGRPLKVTQVSADAAPEVVGEVSYERTAAGKVRSARVAVDEGVEQTREFAWDGAGRRTSSAANGRLSKSQYDEAGRLLMQSTGAGDTSGLVEVFEKTVVTAHNGLLPARMTTTERDAPPVIATMEHNSAGDVTRSTIGSLEWKQKFDELGSLVEASVPGRPAARYETDSRGLVTKAVLPDGAQSEFGYSPGGAAVSYQDPSDEVTSTQRDLIERPLVRTYADGTTERIEWEGSRIRSVTDRQGRKQIFSYNAKGQIEIISDETGAVLDKFTYDSAGRLVAWLNKDCEMTWSEFDLAGNPKRTSQKRFRDESGTSSSPQVLDEYVQEHRWNEHGERTEWSMPAYPGLALSGGWTRWVRESFDAMGNVVSVTKIDDPSATGGNMLVLASYRNAGRPDWRRVTTASGASIVRSYGYDERSSLQNRMVVTAGSTVVAGSELQHDGLQKSDAKLLGIGAGNRHTKWRYDERSRLAASIFGVSDANADPAVPIRGSVREQLTPADFRTAQERVQHLTTASAAGDPPTKTLTERAGGGHKIAEVATGTNVYSFDYAGAELVDDGRFTYEFDAKGRLIRATEKAAVGPVRRLVYSYGGTVRLVGRRAEYATGANPAAGDWRVEDRVQVIAADGLPAETTFVWDAITDRLITVARAGATANSAHGGILKQIIHGGLSYDDPIETATVDPLAPESQSHLYPIYDEAGAGSLQAVVNTNGQLVGRNLSNDPFGGEDLDLAGPAIDRVDVTATTNGDGSLNELTVEIRATEAIASPSLSAGARLAAIDLSGAVVRLFTSTASLADAHTVRWTLSADEWASLTTDASALSIAATSGLRAALWGDVPVLPAPDWVTSTKPVVSSPAFPVEVRESLASLSSFLAGIPPDTEQTMTLYAVESLALLGSSSGGTQIDDILTARMHAHPFAEPLTGINYVRARWYDPGSGSFLTPDPMGYQDSSNLYAFCAGDPVNHRDPTGTLLDSAAMATAQGSTATATAAETTATVGGGGATIAVIGGLAVAGIFTETVGAWIPSGQEGVSIKDWWEELAVEAIEDLSRAPQPVAIPVPNASSKKKPTTGSDPKPLPVPVPVPGRGQNREEEKTYVIRLQAQGGKPPIEKSEVIAQETPITVAQGLAGLESLKLQLSRRELEARADCFRRAARFIQNSPAGGGIAPTKRSFSVPGSDVRVDVEVLVGTNFQF
jgi:RHS repeat-associated protein